MENPIEDTGMAQFPRHDIDPRIKKGKDWNLKVANAIWNSWHKGMPTGTAFYAKRVKCSEIRDYANNKQSVTKYFKWQTGDDDAETAFFNIDQSTEAILKTHRQKILGRLKKVAYNITATPIDATSKGKLDEYYDEQFVRIMLREQAEQIDPSLAQHPAISKRDGDPLDVEQLKMEMEFNPKFIRAKNAEQGINMVFYENNLNTIIDMVDEDMVDFGAGIIKEGIDPNNRVYIKYVPYQAFICSKADNGNYENLSYAAHVEQVPISILANHFGEEDLEKIAQHFSGKDGNPTNLAQSTDLSRGYDDFKGTVLCFEIRSYDLTVTEERKNKKGNLKFNLTDPLNFKKEPKKDAPDQKKYDGKNYEKIYTGKWIVGTEYIYEYGLATNQKRSTQVKKLSKTELSYHVVASSFDKSCTRGITEDLIPIADEIHMTTLKLRNLNNRMIINGLAIDFSALEGVALSGSGEKSLTPQENLDMLFQIGVLGYRSENILADGKNQRKPVEALILDYANQFTALWTNYEKNIIKFYDTSGLNQTTDSATVNPKMLVGIANAQNAGTNNALYFIENARRKLVEKLAKNTIQRLQAALLIGPYEGYVQTLGKQSVDYMRFQEEHLPSDYDIIIEDRPTDEQKQVLYQTMQNDIKAGFLTSGDVFAVMNSYNLKDAEIILNYRSKREKERQQNNAMQREQMNGKIQQEAGIAAEKEKQETLKLQSKLKKEEIELTQGWAYKMEELKTGAKSGDVIAGAATSLITASMSQGAPMGDMDQDAM